MRGFSLVELSIVLVILGLLTGGILAGQSLIRAAELRSMVQTVQRFHAAFYTFRDRYGAIPGDMTNATRFWASAGGTGADATCYMAQTGASNATCNGSGNGQIVSITGASHAERFMAWKHLANAALVEGSYTGRTNGLVGTYELVPGSNIPAGRIGNSFFDLFWIANGNANHFAESRLEANAIGMYGNNATLTVFKPEEAWNIDSKLDDGSPVYGNVVSSLSTSIYNVNCTTSDAATATYNLTSTVVGCYLSYLMR